MHRILFRLSLLLLVSIRLRKWRRLLGFWFSGLKHRIKNDEYELMNLEHKKCM